MKNDLVFLFGIFKAIQGFVIRGSIQIIPFLAGIPD
jgi:hypothetical protein